MDEIATVVSRFANSFDLKDWDVIDAMLSGLSDGQMEFEDSSAVPDGRSFYKLGVEIGD